MTPVELIIKALHFLLVVFIIGAPFFGDAYLQTMHLLIVPFIMMHWITNQSVCALTEMEKLVTGKDCDDETFFGQVVGPVYKFHTRREENFFLWALLIILWSITVFKLHDTGFAYLKHEMAVLRERFA
jgi:hypothetical protein